ncbi:MAG: hypothetical protein ACTHMA_02005 [Thermomicrobiales bacterium]|nr:hypothetical protein [Thermomicrobiales bacterium]
MLDLLHRFFATYAAGDSLVTARLEEALARPGCPVCRLVTRTEFHYFATLFYEHVTTPFIYRRLLASRGCCTEHTWLIIAAPPVEQSPTGVAILFEYLLVDLLRHATSNAALIRWLTPQAPCQACEITARAEGVYLGEYARLAADGVVGSTLCWPHARMLLAEEASGPDVTLSWVRTPRHTGRSAPPGRPRLALAVGRRPGGSAPPAPICPVCRAATRAGLSVPTGAPLCRPHAWALYDAGQHDIAATIQEAVPPEECAACQAAQVAASDACDRLADGSALCLRHLRLALARQRPVRASAIDTLLRLTTDLGQLRESADYQFAGTLTAAQRRSWLTALDCFGGEAIGMSLTEAYTGAKGALRQSTAILDWPH